MAKPDNVNLRELMTQERERLTARVAELQGELDNVKAELAGIERYFGTPARTPQKPRQSTGERAARGSVQQSVLAAISEAGPDGIAPKDITAKVGVASQSVSNALSALKKANKVSADGGLYRAA